MHQYGGIFLVFFGKNPAVVLSGEGTASHGLALQGAGASPCQQRPCLFPLEHLHVCRLPAAACFRQSCPPAHIPACLCPLYVL